MSQPQKDKYYSSHLHVEGKVDLKETENRIVLPEPRKGVKDGRDEKAYLTGTRVQVTNF
jgi:hypothetical protein